MIYRDEHFGRRMIVPDKYRFVVEFNPMNAELEYQWLRRSYPVGISSHDIIDKITFVSEKDILSELDWASLIANLRFARERFLGAAPIAAIRDARNFVHMVYDVGPSEYKVSGTWGINVAGKRVAERAVNASRSFGWCLFQGGVVSVNGELSDKDFYEKCSRRLEPLTKGKVFDASRKQVVPNFACG